jgi:uncharacterized DUF497 family protein
MRITFDTGKDAVNIAKHGVSLAIAEELEWDTLRAGPDTRFLYPELRFVGYALRADRLFCVVFTDQGVVRRIISLRKANRREIRRYAQVRDN